MKSGASLPQFSFTFIRFSPPFAATDTTSVLRLGLGDFLCSLATRRPVFKGSHIQADLREYPFYHRAVARLLRTDPVDQLPWHRVVGSGGEIKLRGAAAHEQRARLRLEGVQFNGKRIGMSRFEHTIKPWEVYG